MCVLLVEFGFVSGFVSGGAYLGNAGVFYRDNRRCGAVISFPGGQYSKKACHVLDHLSRIFVV
jgi:hypothetical protein